MTVVAERELDALERVGRQLAGRIHDMRAALLAISRNRAGGQEAAEIATKALRDDSTAGGTLTISAPYEAPAPLDERVACIRCKTRERQPGSMWCRWCQPARNATAGRD